MAPIPLHSSLLVWVRYEARTRRLEVLLRDGGRYQYFDVPESCYQQLLEADSKGGFFNRSIRNRFPWRDLSLPHAPVVLPSAPKTK